MFRLQTAMMIFQENRTYYPVNTQGEIGVSGYKDAEEIIYTISLIQGRVEITDAENSEYIVQTSSERSPFGRGTFYRSNQKRLYVNLADSGNVPSLSTPDSIRYDVQIGNVDKSKDLNLYTGNSQMEMELMHTEIRDLNLNTIHGDADLIFRGNSIPEEVINIDTVSGTIIIDIEAAVGVKVDFSSSYSNSSLDGEELEQGENYSDNYSSADNTIDIDFETRNGHLFVRRIE